jgi:hypothetical protein
MMSGYTGERLLLTLWVGSLWAIGYLAVPMAFANLETSVAGNYAGKLFYAVNIIGIASGVILLLSRLFIFGLRRFHLYWRSWMLLLMLAICVAFIGYIQPEMHAIKQLDWQQNAELAAQFSRLHMISENLYLMLSLFGLMLVLTTDKRSEADTTA